MSNSSKDILAALNTQLKTVAGLPALVFFEDESVPDPIDSNATFVTAHDMPSGVDSPVINVLNERDRGIYQVSIFTPRGRKGFSARVLADNIKSAFGRNVLLTLGTSKMTFRRVEVGSGNHENGNHYMLPVSVYWQVVG